MKERLVRDTVIVGGGIAGVMCAYFLHQRGYKVTVIEADKLLCGVTKDTTAHINALQAKYSDIPTKKKRRIYFQSQIEAVDGLEQIIKDNKIDCDFMRVQSYVFGQGHAVTDLRKEYELLKQINADVIYKRSVDLPFGNYNTISLENQARFDAVKFLHGLHKGFEIIENTRIKKVCCITKKLKSENRIIKAKRIIIATNFPIINIRGLYAFKMYKSTSYAIAIETDKRVDGIYNAITGDGLTYRDTRDGIIIGGLDHRTGRHKCKNVYKQLSEQASTEPLRAWCANDCMTFDGIAYSGRLKRFFSRDIFVITGFGKWGMTNSFVCGQIIADLIDGKKNKYTRLFKPTRILNVLVWHKFILNAILNVMNILAGLLLGKRCPHMACRMKFNHNTKTWDCPCHGSRLTKGGDIITAPTVDAKKF